VLLNFYFFFQYLPSHRDQYDLKNSYHFQEEQLLIFYEIFSKYIIKLYLWNCCSFVKKYFGTFLWYDICI